MTSPPSSQTQMVPFDLVVRHDKDPVLVADIMHYIPGNWKIILSHRPEIQQRDILNACRRRKPNLYEEELARVLGLHVASHTGSPLTAGDLSSSVDVCRRFLDTPFAAWVRLALGDIPWIFDQLRAIIDESDNLWTKHARPMDPVMLWAARQHQQLDRAILTGIRGVIDSSNCRQTIRRLRILDICFEHLGDVVKRSESVFTTAEWLESFSASLELLTWIESKPVTELAMCLTTEDVQYLQHFDAREMLTNTRGKSVITDNSKRLFKVTQAYVKTGSRDIRVLVDVANQTRRIDNYQTFMAVALGLKSASRYARDHTELQKFLLDTGEILRADNHYSAYRKAQARAYALPWPFPFRTSLSATPILPLADRDRMLGPFLTSISSFLANWPNQRVFESFTIAVVGSGGYTWLDQFAFPADRKPAGAGRLWKTLMRIDEDFAEVHFYLQSHVVEVDSRPSCYIFADGGSPQECIAMNLGRPMLALQSHVRTAFSVTPLANGHSIRQLEGMDDEILVADLIRTWKHTDRPTASAAQILESFHIKPATEPQSAFDAWSPLSDHTRPDKTMPPSEHGYSTNTTPPLEIPTTPVSNTVRKAKSTGTLKAQTKRLFTRIRSGNG